MSEAPVPVAGRPEIARPGAAAVALPAVIVDAGPAAVERFLEFFRGRDRERPDAGGVRAGGGSVPGVVRGAGRGASACGRSRCSTWLPTSGRTGDALRVPRPRRPERPAAGIQGATSQPRSWLAAASPPGEGGSRGWCLCRRCSTTTGASERCPGS